MNFSGILTVTVFLPTVAAFVILLSRTSSAARRIAGISATLTLILSILIFVLYDTQQGGIQLVEYQGFLNLESFKSSYFLGVDGLNAPLILLTGILSFASIFASFGITHRTKEYFFWLLLLQTSVMGVFTSLDMLLFFIFFELEVIPMFMLISIWGYGRKLYSATKFVLFTLAGGVAILIGVLAFGFSDLVSELAIVSVPQLGIAGIPDQIREGATTTLISGVGALAAPLIVIFVLFLIGFAVKLPLWPLHNWLPDAHTDAPTPVSMMLAGVLLKMGGYGLIRINLALFADIGNTIPFGFEDIANILAWFAAISVIYGAIITIRQNDMKRLIAFSSISHMGFVIIGFTAVGLSHPDQHSNAYLGITGASLQMFTHGTITGLAFLMVGLLYDRVHTRHIPHLGGLVHKMPIISIAFMLSGLASLGLPLLSGFVSEILIFIGTFDIWKLQTGIAAFGVVLASGYILWMAQRIFFGKRPDSISEKTYNALQDVSLRDLIPIFALSTPILIIGVWPALITDVLNSAVLPIVNTLVENLR